MPEQPGPEKPNQPGPYAGPPPTPPTPPTPPPHPAGQPHQPPQPHPASRYPGPPPGPVGPQPTPPSHQAPQRPAAGPPPPGGKAFGFFVGLVSALALVTVIGFIVFGALAPSGGGLGMGGHVGLVRAQGMISAETTGGMFGSVGVAPEPFLDELETALSSPACEAVVIRIDSPGGTAAASEEIYRGMLRLKQDYPGKPLIVSMGDVAASGGYYMACAADYIFANSATATGSIGVRSSFLSIEDLITEHGVEATNITSGEYKAMGSMYKDMTDDERAIFKHQVMLIYDDFVSAVAEGRGLPKADVRQVADGRVWLGGDAIDNGLIDEIGGLQEAVEHAGSQVGLSDPEVYDYSLMSLPFGSFLEASSEAMLRGGERYLLERGAAGGVKPFRLQMSGGPLGE